MSRAALALAALVNAWPVLLIAQQPESPWLVESVDVRPVLRDSSCLTARYPAILREAGIEGRVVFEFVVDTTGVVDPESIRVLSSTHQLFEMRARVAIERCRYRPGSQSGKAVRVRMTQGVNFLLPGQ